MKKIKIILCCLLASYMSSHAQDNNILIGLGSPSYGVKIKANFPGVSSGFARGFSISNENNTENFIGFGVLGNVSNGVSNMIYGYIGKEYNDTYMAFRSNGNVGIGTTNPKAKLDINGETVLRTPVNGGIAMHIRLPNETNAMTLRGFSDRGEIHAQNHRNIIIKDSQGKILMYGQHGGNVGVGTTNPEGNFQIGRATQNGMLFLGGGKGYSGIGSTRSDGGLTLGWNIYARYNDASDNFNARIGKTNTSAGYSGIKIAQQGVIDFFGYSGAVTADEIANTNQSIRMRIDKFGNIGIGTTTPDSKLTVKGKIHSEEVKVDLSVPGPDYVFDKDYELNTLEQLQNYIKENKHLPNIPSAKEMEANGIELGIMNMKLLEKIEELTLYTIQQEQQIKTQQKTNQSLEDRLQRLEKILINKNKGN